MFRSDLLARHERLLHTPESELPPGDKASQRARNDASKGGKPARRKPYAQRNAGQEPVIPSTPGPAPAPQMPSAAIVTPPTTNDATTFGGQMPSVPSMSSVPYISPAENQTQEILPSPLSLNLSLDVPSSAPMASDFNPGGDPGMLFGSQPWPVDCLDFDRTSLSKPFPPYPPSPDRLQHNDLNSINQPVDTTGNPSFSLPPPAAVNPLGEDPNLVGLNAIPGGDPTLSETPLFLNPQMNTGLQDMSQATSPPSITPMAGLDPDGVLSDADIQAMLPLGNDFPTQRPGWYDSTGPTIDEAKADPIQEPGS